MLRLKVKYFDLFTNYPLAILNVENAKDLGINPNDRIKVTYNSHKEILIVETTHKLVPKGQIGMNIEALEIDSVKDGKFVRVEPVGKPISVEYIKKKLSGKELTPEECRCIIDDINDNCLSNIEMGAYVSAVYTHDFSMKELTAIVSEMVNTGKKFHWNHRLVSDKHSIGGVPGNRITPIIVSIVASAGLVIPKTSSRAITSPSGTADTMEVWCNVNFNRSEIKKIVEKTGSCFVWGGAVDMAPTDDKIINAEYPLSLDPEGQLIASVMAKKIAMGAKYLIIDIPFGLQTKVATLEDAETLAIKFKKIGKMFDIKTECTITVGDQPIGIGLGPVPEAIDILGVLEGNGQKDLKEKSIELAGALLKMTGKGDKKTAEHILDSKIALAKFKEIVKAQKGDPDKDLHSMLGKYIFSVKSKRSGKVSSIHNKELTQIARLAGAPVDIGSGIILKKKLDDPVAKGDILFEIYSEKEFKLKNAKMLLERFDPIVVQDHQNILVKKI
ncbi:MAG: AMP phosphorylase [Candidatus Aenigmarchaeota archaeon]|nr:AMP phosphorylase [Candidatus Aenigmarchaeota archaeon]MCK5322259.1 AMP phosphorylase [Candidatus Aenigmarchaeota archaeon]